MALRCNAVGHGHPSSRSCASPSHQWDPHLPTHHLLPLTYHFSDGDGGSQVPLHCCHGVKQHYKPVQTNVLSAGGKDGGSKPLNCTCTEFCKIRLQFFRWGTEASQDRQHKHTSETQLQLVINAGGDGGRFLEHTEALCLLHAPLLGSKRIILSSASSIVTAKFKLWCSLPFDS